MPSTSIYGSFMAPKKLSSGTDNRAKSLPGASAMNFPRCLTPTAAQCCHLSLKTTLTWLIYYELTLKD